MNYDVLVEKEQNKEVLIKTIGTAEYFLTQKHIDCFK